MFKKTIISSLEKIDKVLSKTYLRLFKEKNSLMIFLFHSLFLNEDEIKSGIVDVDIKEAITVDHFRKFIEYYLSCGYNFISPDEILRGLKKDQKHALITFDDGYYNNSFSLSVLNEFDIPAVFFISTKNIKENKSFWWDVLYRERKKQNALIDSIYKERSILMNKTNYDIEKYLISEFGERSLISIGDTDRPFTFSELKNFSKNKNVIIGNHTDSHVALTNYSMSDIKVEISKSQKIISQEIGITPEIIAYPYGKFSDNVINVSKELGFKIGVTTTTGKNYFPIENFLNMKRFVFKGNKLSEQCELFRSDIQLISFIKRLIKK